jgi:hypothetical protein
MLLLTLLLSNRVHGFGGVSMNPLLLSSRIVTRGYSLTRTHSERNDKAFLSWNMARTSTTRHANADANAEGFTASEYKLIEMMRSIVKSQNDTVDEVRKNQKTQDDKMQSMQDQIQGMKDEMRSTLETHHRIMMDELQAMEKREDKRHSTLEDMLDVLIEDKTRAEARLVSEFADDFS